MSKTPGTLTSENFARIWLEPREGADPYIGRQWCQDNQWGEDGIEYVRADLVALQSATEAPSPQTRMMAPANLEEVAASIGFVLDNKRWEDCSEGFKETCRECAAVADRLIREERL